MQDKQEYEVAAIATGARAGGEYLESIGLFDLRALSVEQFMTFAECIITGWQEHIRQTPAPF